MHSVGFADGESFSLFALHDSDDELKRKGSFTVSKERAGQLNAEGYGIFHVVNAFEGRRLITNLVRIRYWTCELDLGQRSEQVARIKRAPLLPSVVVESKRGFHLYYRALDAELSTWARVVRWGLIPALGGDPKASDPLRLLRCPGYEHKKDPANPFMVRVVWRTDAIYSTKQMLRAFPNTEPTAKPKAAGPAGEADGFWEKVARLDGREALARLGGHWLMNGEKFSLQEQVNGNANVVRSDGYSTGSFVDRDGKLGNVDGGASIAAWCAWYGHDWATVARGLREVFPELDKT